MSEIKLKDFILTEIPEPEKKVCVDKSQIEYDFTLEYENDTDFILRRKTARTDKSLVVIVSQAQIYIKDNKENKVECVVSKEQLNKFKSGLTEVPVFEKLIWKPFVKEYNWHGNQKEYMVRLADEFVDFLSNKETYKKLANKKLNPFKENKLVDMYVSAPELFNKKLEMIKVIRLMDSNFTINMWDSCDIINGALKCNLHESFVTRNKDIIDALGVNLLLHWIKTDSLQSILNDYNVDFGTLLTYLLYVIKYRNGLNISDYYCGGSTTSFSIFDYYDYLANQKEMYGKVKEKYPQYWLSEKQMMCNKYNAWKKYKRNWVLR